MRAHGSVPGGTYYRLLISLSRVPSYNEMNCLSRFHDSPIIHRPLCITERFAEDAQLYLLHDDHGS